MARIRSVHPGQWDDDDFCDVSFPARLLALALRNHADDRGIFEWKPRQIKIACMPADAIEIEPLLAELAEPKLDGPHAGHGRLVEPFSVGGRRFGAVRNFGKWQRVQKPKPVYPHPTELNDYSGLASSAKPITGIDVFAGGVIIGITSLSGGVIPVAVTEFGIRGMRKEEGGRSIPKTSSSGPAGPQGEILFPSKDDRTWLFREGLDYLAEASGKKPPQLRALVGRWLKDLGDDAGKLRAIIEGAAEGDKADPMGWITKAVQVRRNVAPAAPAPDEADRIWGIELAVWTWRRFNSWSYELGSNPDASSCSIDPAILAKYPKPRGDEPFTVPKPERPGGAA